jgi:hypothetical protein
VNVELADGSTVDLKPCPPWCLGDHGFPQGAPVPVTMDGFHHAGPDTSVAVAWRAWLTDGPPDRVTARLASFTMPLDADPGPARIDLHLQSSTDEASTELTPAEARALAACLLMLADTAQRVSDHG